MTQQSIVDSLRNNYMPYTAHVIMSRALPEIDGLKPSQRRILYTMFKMGLLKGNRKKSQGVVGQTMFLHPHGDMAIYETLVRMAKDNESLLLPYIDSKGNFGKQYSRDMKYASARYTEVKLSDNASELFHDIDQNTVDMIDNYDGTLREPRLLPVTYPSILINTSSGTAVGMASSVAPFNLIEVIDFTITYIENKETVVSDYILAPDFPTGGHIVHNAKDFDQIYETGKGSFKIRATYKIQGNSIIFEQIPYTTTFEAIIDKITDLVKEGKIKDIVDIDDIYGIDSKGIEIQVKNNTDKERLIARLYKLTPLEDSFACNFNIIVNGRPQTLGIKQIIHEWIEFRSNCIQRGAIYELDKKEKKKHLLKALKQVLLDIDKAIAIIRSTKLNNQVVSNLMDAFQIDELQAEYVAEIKLRSLNEEYLLSRIQEIEKLEKEIQGLHGLINEPSKRSKVIVEQLKRVKSQYGKERSSQIIHVDDLSSMKEEQISIENYNVRVFVTKEGYLKKIPLVSLRSSNQLKVKDGDQVVREMDTTNNSDILIFTNQQNCYKYKTYELDDHKPSSLGEFLPTLLGLKDEEILYVTVTNDYKGHLIIGFDDGKVAKIDLSAYSTKHNRTMLKNAYADKQPIYWDATQEDYDLMALSTIDKIIVVNTSMINPKTSKTTIGVQLMKSKKASLVSDYHRLSTEGYEEREYYRTLSAGVGKYYREGDFTDLVDMKKKRLGQGLLI
ncbi:DNA topoisomerase (ATP-hydrolyzing) subunit A [Thermoactinomyces sp. DSM 45892]|uniref:DNA gyrase/topoisomerase IV subunit A n=1 Tax=Thermoactinomyces sp. DSM 45892 TaxID=1882753 RepID=UPI000894D4C4|nr:DNA topoisomerase (ATP-hydrolyzing) subunit A [Thermoactinomyces sp. DSM 45892]SDX93628.1 DNA gyrase subunit A [Thermoactinomyces sp. DSM 45892]